MERFIILKVANRKRVIALIILFNLIFYFIGFSTWIYYNQQTHASFLRTLLKENTKGTSSFLYIDSLHIPRFGTVDVSLEKPSKSPKGWREETADYIAHIEYTKKYPRLDSPIERIHESELSYLLYKKWFFPHILHRFVTDSLDVKYGISPTNIAIRLEHSPTYLVSPTTKITFTHPEKKDSILASMCYIDSFPISFNYKKALVISDTLEIGIQGEGRLIAYTNMPPYTIINEGMRTGLYNLSIASIVLFSVSCVIVFMLYFRKEKIVERVIEKEVEKEVEKILYVEKIYDLPENQEPIYEWNKLIIKPESNCIVYEGRTLRRRKMIVQLLLFLINEPNHFIGKEEFEHRFWEERKLDPEILNKSIHSLIYDTKQTLKGMPFELRPIRGLGYKLLQVDLAEKEKRENKSKSKPKKKPDSPPPE